MKVTERLQHASTAASFFAGLALAIFPVSTFGQIVTTSDPYDPIEQPNQNQAQVVSPDSGDSQFTAADISLFEARRAIAQGDVLLAEQHMNYASSLGTTQNPYGDSPEVIQTLINKQNELSRLYDNRDPAYNVQAANFLILQASALLKYEDFASVETLIKQAKAFPVDPAEYTTQPATVLAALATSRSVSAGNYDQSQLAVSEVLSLMSKAQFAFDKGDLESAQTLTDKAKAYGVADAKLPANQILPWQLELRIQEAMRSNGRVVAAGYTNSNQDGVVQAAYDPANDTTENIQVSALPSTGAAAISSTQPEFKKIPGRGRQYFDSAINALKSNDLAAARRFFEMAWENREQLDANLQQTIQDQLTNLPPLDNSGIQAEVLPNPGTSASQIPQQQDSTQLLLSDNAEREKFRRLQSEFFRQHAAAERVKQEDPRAAIEMMTQMRTKVVEDQDISDKDKTPLLAIIDREIGSIQKFIEKNLSEIQLREKNAAVLADVQETRQKRYNTEFQIQKLVEDYNDLMDEQRFHEADMVARQVFELSPESEIASLLRTKSSIAVKNAEMERIRDAKADGFWSALRDVDEDSIHNVSDGQPLVYTGDLDRWARNAERREKWLTDLQYDSPEEAAIWNKLKNEKVQGTYQGTLNDAINQLSQQTGINILFDEAALASDNLTTSNSINVPIRQPISLRSALNVILGSSGLVFVVEDEVIKVTSKDAQRRDVKPVTYYVGDLVTPIQNFQHSLNMSFMSPNGNAGQGGVIGQSAAVPLANHNAPSISPLQIASQTAGAPQALAQQLPGVNPVLGGAGGFGGGPVQSGSQQYNTIGPQALGGVSLQDFQPLINLIRTTIDPDGWDDTNGDGAIQAFVPNLSLIVSQTQEVQDQIQDLLEQLRELNDVQIVVEVRFVSLADSFFERIGIDFDFNINEDSALVAGSTPGDVVGPSTTVGLNPSITPGIPNFPFDFDIPFQQNSFTSALPTLGTPDIGSAANFGFAILSDIEVFFLLQAAKGDSRTNVTQAPTLTMFNGQVASVIDGALVPFVTSVIPVVGDFAVAQQPVITILPEGTNLNVSATVSNDRKSVRMTLVPYFSQIQDVQNFTFDGSTTTQRATDDSLIDDLLGVVTGGGVDDDTPTEIETVTEGVTIQLPTIGQTSVSTVVSVPDGGTILLGGVKRQTEQRLERGVPFLSNIPYVSRLFKNVGISRDTTSLMMMVSPRIIIQEEEELEQVGTTSRRRN